MRLGFIFYNGKPIRVNITVWVFIDVIGYLEKAVKQSSNNKAAPKTMKDMFSKEYGPEILNLFDSVFDCSQYSNLEIMGTKYLKYQENFILESFADHLEGV